MKKGNLFLYSTVKGEMKKMIFQKSIDLIANVEHKLLSKQTLYNKLIKDVLSFFNLYIIYLRLTREIFLPFKLMIKGIDITFKGLQKFIIIFLIGGSIVLFLSRQFSIDNTTILSNIMVFIVFFIAVFSTIFSVPSTISKYGVIKEDIDNIIREITNLKIEKEEIQYIQKNIESFQQKFKNKINFFRALLMFSSGLISFFFTKKVDLILASKNNIELLDNMSSISTEVNLYWLLLFIFFIVESYNKGGLFIFKSVEFSLVEVELFYKKPLTKHSKKICYHSQKEVSKLKKLRCYCGT